MEARSLQLLFHACARATLIVRRLSMTSQVGAGALSIDARVQKWAARLNPAA